MAITDITVNSIVDSDGNTIDTTSPYEYEVGKTNVRYSAEINTDDSAQYTLQGVIEGEPQDSTTFTALLGPEQTYTVLVPFNSANIPTGSYSQCGVINQATGNGDTSGGLTVTQPDIASISNLTINQQAPPVTITEGSNVPFTFDVDVNTADTYSFTAETSGGTQIGSTSTSLSIGVQTVTISSLESDTSTLSPGTFTVTISANSSSASVTSVDGLVVEADDIQLSVSGSDADVGGSLNLNVQSGEILNIRANDADVGGSLDTSLLSGVGLTIQAEDADVSSIGLDGDIVPSDAYVVDGLFLEYQSEVRRSDEIEWTFVVTQRYLRLLQSLLDQAGEVSVVEKIGGGFESIDRSNGKATFPVRPPSGRSDVRSVDTWLIRSYEVEYLSSDGKQMLVTLVASPEREKTGASSNPYSTIDTPTRLSDSSDQWLFEFKYGDVLTSRVTSNLSSSSDAQLQVYSLELIATPNEVRRIEESCGLSASVTVREIPDGANFVSVDTDGGNVVSISPPTTAEDDIDTGKYAVLSWETVYNRGAYVVTLEVVKA